MRDVKKLRIPARRGAVRFALASPHQRGVVPAVPPQELPRAVGNELRGTTATVWELVALRASLRLVRLTILEDLLDSEPVLANRLRMEPWARETAENWEAVVQSLRLVDRYARKVGGSESSRVGLHELINQHAPLVDVVESLMRSVRTTAEVFADVLDEELVEGSDLLRLLDRTIEGYTRGVHLLCQMLLDADGGLFLRDPIASEEVPP